MKIEIKKERRKTISLKVLSSENAVMKVPFNLSQSKVQEFLQAKQSWLEKTALNMKNNEAFSSSFQLDKQIYINGERLMQTKDLALDFDKLSMAKRRALIRKCYLSHFSQLVHLAEEVSLKTGLKFKEVKPTNSVRVWGSFNSAGVTKFNWKLLILPRYLAEYVVVHELCHGLHMNHSPKFWREVEKFCPEYKKLKKELSSYSFLLKPDAI